MKKYDYILVGSGLYSGCLCLVCEAEGKEVSGSGKEGSHWWKCLL